EVVFYRLRDAADRYASFVKLVCDRQRAFAAENDERVDPEHLHVRNRFFVNGFDAHRNAVFLAFDEVSLVTSAEDGAAARQESAHVGSVERPCPWGAEEAVEAVFDTDHAHAILANGGLHHRANYRVQTGSISAACQNS